MITLTMDATLYMQCDPESGLVEHVTIQTATDALILIVAKDGATEEQVVNALHSASHEPWPALTNLPNTVEWEGEEVD